MSDEPIIWEAPPDPKTLPPSLYEPLLEAVKGKPGSWARIRSGPSASMYSAKRRLDETAGKTDLRWEFKNARVGEMNGKAVYGLWARYRTPEQVETASKRRR
jgi:hypothetical protein